MKTTKAATVRAGFTLTELLVTLGVIAVLLAILFPALRSIREASRATVCLANLRSLGVAIGAYHTDTELLPDVILVVDDGLGGGGSALPPLPLRPSLADALTGYVDAPLPAREVPGDITSPWQAHAPWACPSDDGYVLPSTQAENPFDTAWAWDGSSYQMGPSTILYLRLATAVPNASRPAMQRVITRGLERRDWPMVIDADRWHGDGSRWNTLFFPDGRAEPAGPIPEGALDAFVAEFLPFLEEAL
ncbi:MAG: type II secretion system protein [Planctomycetota bacterium]